MAKKAFVLTGKEFVRVLADYLVSEKMIKQKEVIGKYINVTISNDNDEIRVTIE